MTDYLIDLVEDDANANWLHRRKEVTKEWVDDGTSRSGKRRWRNTASGEVRYQDSKPGERRGRKDDDGPARERPKDGEVKVDHVENMIDSLDRGLVEGPNWRDIAAGPETTQDLGRRAMELKKELESGPYWREFKALMNEEGRINLSSRLSDAKTWAAFNFPSESPPEWLPPARATQDRGSIASAIAVMEAFKANAEQLAFPPDPRMVNIQGLWNSYEPYYFSRDSPQELPANLRGEMDKLKARFLSGDLEGWSESELQTASILAFAPQLQAFRMETGVRAGLDDTFTKEFRGEATAVAETTRTAVAWIDHAQGVMKRFKDGGYPMPDSFEVGVNTSLMGSAWGLYFSKENKVRLVINSESLRKLPDGFASSPDSFHPVTGRESVLVHELGHAFHHKSNAVRWEEIGRSFKYHDMSGYIETDWASHLHKDGLRDYVRYYIGDYAVSHPKELVAEVFMAAHGGRKIPPKVFEMYQEWGGYVDDTVRSAVDETLPTPRQHYLKSYTTKMLKQNIYAQRYDFGAEFLEKIGRSDLAVLWRARAQSYRTHNEQARNLGIDWDPTVDVLLDEYHHHTKSGLVNAVTNIVFEETLGAEAKDDIYGAFTDETKKQMREEFMLEAQAAKYVFTRQVEQMAERLPEAVIVSIFDELHTTLEERQAQEKMTLQRIGEDETAEQAAHRRDVWKREMRWFHDTARRFLGEKWMGGVE